MYLGDLATVNVNLAGLPALVLPVAYVDSPESDAAGRQQTAQLPVGLQLVGRNMGEEGLLRLGYVLEQDLQLTMPPLAPIV
jgi:aspartyl-tRNA(Asn)/glutamyl-tRNA(Gln) amidotransferase subunit A